MVTVKEPVVADAVESVRTITTPEPPSAAPEYEPLVAPPPPPPVLACPAVALNCGE